MNRIALRFVLGSIAVNALIGIFAIVSGDFSALDGKILVTSLSVTGGSILSLANLTARTRGTVRIVPEIGAAASVVGFALLIYLAWDDFDSGNVGRSAASGILIGAGSAHGVLLSLSKLLPRYVIVLRAAWAFAAVLVLMIIIVIWADDIGENGAFIRTMGVVIVLLAATTLAVPVLHRASRGELAAAAPSESGQELYELVFCPSCGGIDLAVQGTECECVECGARFEVRFKL